MPSKSHRGSPVTPSSNPVVATTDTAATARVTPLLHNAAVKAVVAAMPTPRRQRGAIYARFSTRFQHSIDDQVRKCLEWAAANNVDVADVHVFKDEGISGRSRNRPGLTAMLKAIANAEVDVVIAFSTNRVHRRQLNALKFVHEEIVDAGKRCVFVNQNIDTAKTETWSMLLNTYAQIDELQATMQAGAIRSGHQGHLLEEHVIGTITFGFCANEISGRPTKRALARRRYEIDSTQSQWVQQIFYWFVVDKLDRAEILRRLIERNAPLPPKSTKGKWTDLALKRVLTNRRYIGDWSYGRTKNVWQNKADYSRQVPLETPQMPHRIERLRIIDDETFNAAQVKLLQKKHKGDRKRRNRDERETMHILHGLVWCTKHQVPLVSYGHDQAFCCMACVKDGAGRELFSQADRDIAAAEIFKAVADRIVLNTELVESVIASCQGQAAAIQAQDISPVADLNRRRLKLTNQIDFACNQPGETLADQQETATRLKRLRNERTLIDAEIQQAQGPKRRVQIPTPAQAQIEATRIGQVLAKAAASKDPDVLAQARHILELLTGGKMMARQCGERRHHRGWLQAVFAIDILRCVGDTFGLDTPSPSSHEIIVDLRRHTVAEARADEVKCLADTGMPMAEIATKLKLHRSQVTAAWKEWHASRGLIAPDGRKRRSTLVNKGNVRIPKCQQIADRVLTMVNEKRLIAEIAKDLHVDGNTVTASIRFLNESRGLTIPDGRTRRKQLPVKITRMRLPTDEVGTGDSAAA